MKFVWRGETFEMIDRDDLGWDEAELLEDATGYTSSEINEDNRIAGKARVVAAQIWLAVRRQNPDVDFAEFFASKLGQFEPEDTGEEKTAAAPPVDPGDPLDDSAGNTSEDSGTST